ncbi:MAG: hypothetical protein ACNA71_00585 [Kiritimatiellia bacterium]
MNVSRGSIAWRKRVVAVDYNDGHPIALRAERRGARLSWEPVAIADVQKLHVAGDVVVAGMDVGTGMTPWLAVPLKDVRKARRIWPAVLDTKLPFALEESKYAIGAAISGELPGLPVLSAGTVALSTVVRRNDLERVARSYGTWGFVPHTFDHEGLALWSMLDPALTESIRVVVWCRPSSMLMVLGMGNVYWSSHPIAGHDVERVMRLLHLQKQTVAKGMYKDLAIEWYVGGDEERYHLFLADLEGVPSEKKQILGSGPYGLAKSLAARALLPGVWRMPAIWSDIGANYRSSILQRRYLRDSAYLALLGALLIAGVGGRRVYVGMQMAQQDRAIARVVDEIAGYRVVARGRDAVRVAAGELESRRLALDVFLEGEDLSVIAGRLVALVSGTGGQVQEMALDSQSVRLRVLLPAENTIDAVVQSLLASGYRVVPLEAGDAVDGKVLYTVRGERGQL